MSWRSLHKDIQANTLSAWVLYAATKQGVKTGDNTPIFMMVGLLVGAFIVMVMSGAFIRKRRR